MNIESKQLAVLRDVLLECGFTMPVHQLISLMYYNEANKGSYVHLAGARLASDVKEMVTLHQEALDEAAIWDAAFAGIKSSGTNYVKNIRASVSKGHFSAEDAKRMMDHNPAENWEPLRPGELINLP